MLTGHGHAWPQPAANRRSRPARSQDWQVRAIVQEENVRDHVYTLSSVCERAVSSHMLVAFAKPIVLLSDCPRPNSTAALYAPSPSRSRHFQQIVHHNSRPFPSLLEEFDKMIICFALWMLDLALLSNMAQGDIASAPVDSLQTTDGALSNDQACYLAA
jgi:hypothetical protein